MHRNLLGISDLHALRVEVSGAEADSDIDQEHNVDDQIKHGVVSVLLKRRDDILERYCERVENSSNENQTIPDLLILVELLNDG